MSVYGAVPFFGKIEISVHLRTHYYSFQRVVLVTHLVDPAILRHWSIVNSGLHIQEWWIGHISAIRRGKWGDHCICCLTPPCIAEIIELWPADKKKRHCLLKKLNPPCIFGTNDNNGSVKALWALMDVQHSLVYLEQMELPNPIIM